MAEYDYDVAVVGVGASGGVLVNLLGELGVRTVAFDRSVEGVQLPRAVGMDGEMMRVAQTVHVADDLESLMRPFPGAQYLDREGNVVARREALTGNGAQGWPDRYHFHQPDFERVFRAAVKAHPSVETRLGYEVEGVALGENGGGVVTATEIETGTQEKVTARFVVGTDGGRSVVRRAAGIRFSDFGLNQAWVVVDLAAHENWPLPGIVTHYPDPVTPVIYIDVVRDIRRFEFCTAPGEDLSRATEPEEVWKRLARWITPDQATLLRAAVYYHNSLVAENWHDGPIIVAGDAAHQTPPFMGQGLCAGIRDVSSLAWRLAAIVQDGASDSLVDEYESERSQHARTVIQAATALGELYRNPDKEKLEAVNASVGREGRGEPPQLGPGLWEGARPAGTLAPQPRLGDGRLLDDAIGYRFGVIGTSLLLAGLSAETRQIAKAAHIEFVEATGEVARWLADLGAQAAVLRPDRYYYGTFEDAASLDDALRAIAREVAPSTL